ncbi:hypothetical protein [Fontibacillus sp. BL9]|uniref:hypothetical protein n=1 Tax=Fontibacillus sp. BL9 TaxID=3389971 RepID=UPI0039786AB2
MRKLPSGLTAFEPLDPVRREAQNANIETIDKLFDNSNGHRHTGKPGDAPQIGKEGIASGAIERHHFRNGKLSENVALYKPVSVTSGVVMGLPTVSYYTKNNQSQDDKHCWYLAEAHNYPAQMTLELKGLYKIDAISFDLIDGPNPVNIKVEIGYNMADWKVVAERDFDPYDNLFLPVTDSDQYSHVRITINKPTWEKFSLKITKLAVYSQDTVGNENDPLEDRRTWGLTARLQGMIGVTDYPLYDFGDSVALTGHWFIINPVTNASICIYGDANKKYPLANGDYLYIDFKYFSSNQDGGMYPAAGKRKDFLAPLTPYEYPDRLILMIRSSGKLYFSPLINPLVEKRAFAQALKQSNEETLGIETVGELMGKGIGKKVQRGLTEFPASFDKFTSTKMNLPISPVQTDKAYLSVIPIDPNYDGYIYDGSLKGRFVSNNEIEITIGNASDSRMIAWEVIEYV